MVSFNLNAKESLEDFKVGGADRSGVLFKAGNSSASGQPLEWAGQDRWTVEYGGAERDLHI